MKKVLILSYFFPPGNFAGSYRVYAWAKYLHNSGYFPIIVTRKYDWAINNFADLSKPTSKGIAHEICDNYEVYYLPYNGNFKDKIFNKFGERRLILFRKFLSFIELVSQNVFLDFVPYKNLYYFSKKILKKNPEIDLIIASGKPYILFKLCYELSNRFGKDWIADYRDPWSTHPWFKNRGILSVLDERFEKKWVSTASAITSCSTIWAEQISNYVGVPGFDVLNGYEPDANILIKDNTPQNDNYIIVHNGTLYDDQQIEIFSSAFNQFVLERKTDKIKLYFIGVGIDQNQVKRIELLFNESIQFVKITERLPKSDVIEIMSRSSLLLLFGQENIKGWYPIKVFDYLFAKKKILLCPSDNDVLETLIKDTNSGFVANSVDEVVSVLSESYKNWNDGIDFGINNNIKEVQKYSREYQTKKLAVVFDKINEEKVFNRKVIQSFSKRDFVFKLIYKVGINKLLYYFNKNKITVLCFHNISDEINYSYPHLSVAVFEKIIIYLKKNFNIIRLDQISEIIDTAKPSIIITFDDGYKDFVNNALPILIKHNVPSLNNITVGCLEGNDLFWSAKLNLILDAIYKRNIDFSFSHNNISFTYKVKNDSQFEQISIKLLKELYLVEKEEREIFLCKLADTANVKVNSKGLFMDWEDLIYCIKNGVTIGSHTLTHDSLISAVSTEQIITEVHNSKIILEEKLKIDVSTIAFPNGLFNDTVLKISNHLYKYILSTEETGLKRKDVNEFSDNLILPRISLNKKTFEENILKLNNFHNIVKFNF